MVAYLAFQRNPPRFKGSITSATALSSATPIKYPSIIDTASGWNVSTGQYTFQYPGTYSLKAQNKWGNVTPGTVALVCTVNSASSALSPNATNAVFGGPQLECDLVVSAGDVLSMSVTIGFTTQSDAPADNNFLILTWTGS